VPGWDRQALRPAGKVTVDDSLLIPQQTIGVRA
jgi:hypothetical protein